MNETRKVVRREPETFTATMDQEDHWFVVNDSNGQMSCMNTELLEIQYQDAREADTKTKDAVILDLMKWCDEMIWWVPERAAEEMIPKWTDRKGWLGSMLSKQARDHAAEASS